MPLVPPSSSTSRRAVTARLRAAGCVFAGDEARLLIAAARSAAELEGLVGRRLAGEPLEHVLGWVEFCGLRIEVDPGVFVPRRRTEGLVREAVAVVLQGAPGVPQSLDQGAGEPSVAGPCAQRPLVVVDLCCGSGAVGAAVLALVAARRQLEVHGVDVDPAALACARRNLAGSGACLYVGDLFDPLPAGLCGRVGLIMANAPYVPTRSIALLPPEARLHEPRVALDGGADGLDVQRRVIAAALQWLAPGGYLLVETSENQAARTVETFARGGLNPRLARDDKLGATVVVGRR